MKRIVWVVLIAAVIVLGVFALGPGRVADGLDGVADNLEAAGDQIAPSKADAK